MTMIETPQEDEVVKTEEVSTSQPVPTKQKKPKKWYVILINILLDILIIALIGLIALFIFISPVKIEGGSMENTLHNEQLVATLRFAPSSYSVGDVVTIKVGDKIIIKRIVATAGESIAFVKEDDGGVYLYKLSDGEWKRVDESYIKEKPIEKDGLFKDVEIYSSPSAIIEGIKIEEGKVYVLGDNRNVSVDSRTYGQFATTDIISKMVFNISENGFMNFVFTVLFPFSKGETHND